MKLVSFRIDGKDTYGAIAGGGVVDLGARLGAKYPDLKSLLASRGLAEAQVALKDARADAKLEAVTLLPVIPNPGKIFCIGHNYEEHRLETERDPTAHPSVFLRLPESQVGHGQPILCPRESAQLDYEGEIAIVIGTPGRRIAEGEAWAHIAGYSCYNDGSVRDWQRHTGQFTPGKNFAATGAFGPWLVPAGEIPTGERLTLTTRLNGNVMQEATTEMMIFPIPRLIAYCSTFLALATGDVIVTGTPGGVGARRTPPVYMKPGDVVEVEVSRIGVLRNTIAVD
jgi:2-keto-4-pentenoate hydratase/2-oxohepta-3-ene-1,7-dioic acid hydratase in catechol pathway